jgi:hypothetical protein
MRTDANIVEHVQIPRALRVDLAEVSPKAAYPPP